MVGLVGEAAKVLDQSKINEKKFERMVLTTKTFNQKQFNEQASIFVKNLPEKVTEQHLFSVFSSFGTILACQVNAFFTQIFRF
jgi:RNA recognition motif-containing protein